MSITWADCSLILESLGHARQAFEQYEHYPSEEFRRERIDAAQTAMRHVRAYRRGLPKNGGQE